MNKFLSIYRNRWFRFSAVAVLYLLFVIWLGSYWFLLGEIVIFDIYISKKVRWAFWKPKRGKDGKREKGSRNAALEWADA
ncbi:MAG: S26 family signal peptidase, partial [Prevotellaceae bacterium]|nr:S26 family signal peptidase [Prevotellaceae bacterium]